MGASKGLRKSPARACQSQPRRKACKGGSKLPGVVGTVWVKCFAAGHVNAIEATDTRRKPARARFNRLMAGESNPSIVPPEWNHSSTLLQKPITAVESLALHPGNHRHGSLASGTRRRRVHPQRGERAPP